MTAGGAEFQVAGALVSNNVVKCTTINMAWVSYITATIFSHLQASSLRGPVGSCPTDLFFTHKI